MDLKNLDSSEQETAVQLFKLGLIQLAADLADVNSKYKAAQEAFLEIQETRKRIAGKYNTIISLITKAGGQIDEREVNLASLEPRYLLRQDAVSHEDNTSRINLKPEETVAKARPIIRNEVKEVLRVAGKVQTANEVLSLIRRKFGEDIPDSTVTSALSVQYKAGVLRRYSASNGTSLYGLPEWFANGKPKKEHSDGQMSIMS